MDLKIKKIFLPLMPSSWLEFEHKRKALIQGSQAQLLGDDVHEK